LVFLPLIAMIAAGLFLLDCPNEYHTLDDMWKVILISMKIRHLLLVSIVGLGLLKWYFLIVNSGKKSLDTNIIFYTYLDAFLGQLNISSFLGNTVIIKPSELSPTSASLFEQLFTGLFDKVTMILCKRSFSHSI
jgi:hypothetical protein